jgi:hypothetical protein
MKLSTSQKNYYEEGNQLNSNSKYNDHDVKCIVQNELKKYAEKKLADSRFTVTPTKEKNETKQQSFYL